MGRPRSEERQPEPTTARILPAQLRIVDRLTDETGEWEVIGRPYPAAGGKNVHVRAELTTQPGVIENHLWGAHDRVAVGRGSRRSRGPTVLL